MNQTLVKFLDNVGVLSLSRALHRARPIILMYHRILEDRNIPGVSPAVFDRQLQYLKKHFNVISIDRLVSDISRNEVQPLSVAITFDDGHRDFYDNAWPLLQKHGLPASLYVTTGFIDNQYWLWPDYLRHVLMNTEEQEVTIPEVGTLPMTRADLLTTWNTIGDYCLTLKSADRWPFLRQLAERLGVREDGKPKAPFAPLTWDQLREMHQQGLDVGSHSVSHPILSSLSEVDLRYELEYSRRRLVEELGVAPKGICYPNGMAKDVTEKVEAMAAQFYDYGLVAYPRQVDPERPMRLGRWAASASLTRFKQTLNGLSRNDNCQGEYR